MFKEYEIRVKLKETKPDGKVRSKHTRKQRVVLTKEVLDRLLADHPDRSKHNLFIQVHEIDENGKPTKKPSIEKEIFPHKKVEYSEILRTVDHHYWYGQHIWTNAEYHPLFEYYCMSNDKPLETHWIINFHESGYRNYYEYYPKTHEGGAWGQEEFDKFRTAWSEFVRYDRLEQSIIAAVSDPRVTEPEKFEALLQNRKVIDRVIAREEGGEWEVRIDKESGKVVLSSKDHSVQFNKHRLAELVEALHSHEIVDCSAFVEEEE